jgi:two-component system sensor histidine kinase/response regulator
MMGAARDATERDQFITRTLTARFLSEQAVAEFSHVPVAAMAMVLVWKTVHHWELAVWAILFSISCVVRTVVRRRTTRLQPLDRIPGALRMAIVGVAAVWGVGVIVAAVSAPLIQVAVLLIIVCGLTAASTSTLLGDATTYRAYSATMLGLTLMGVLPLAADRAFAVAAVLVALFGLVMLALYARLSRILTQSLNTEYELVASRETVERERAFLEHLIVRAPSALVVIDAERRVLRVNPAFETMFGYSADEALGKPVDGLIVPPHLRESALNYKSFVQLDSTFQRELVRCRKDGSEITVRASATLISAERGGMLVMYDDISETKRTEQALRESEARLFQTLASLPVGILVVDSIGTPYFINEVGTKLLGRGVDPAPKAAGLAEAYQAYVVGTDEPYPLERAPILLALAGERATADDMEIRRPHDRITIEIFASPIRDETGKVSFAVAAFTDITERRRGTEAIQAARVAAEEATAAKSAFLANMSHEIRTPLNGILGMAELLLDGELSAEDCRSVGLIISSGESLLSVINDILDFSKIEARQLELDNTEMDLASIVDSAAHLLMPNAAEQGIELVTEIAADIPTRVLGDPTRVRQVLLNLISNAVKFTSRGEVVVTAEMREPSGNPPTAARFVFAVRDTGIGIPPDKLDAVFDAFRQADTATTRRYGGTGLGLSISRRLVDLMGGTLTVESTVGVGTTFRFDVVLPVVDSPDVDIAPPVELTGVRVLVVDDNGTNRRVMRGTLESAGCIVTEAENGADGLRALRAEQETGRAIQIVVTDLVMPGLDGFDLVRAMRGDASIAATAAVMMTSVSRRGDAQRCRDLAVGAYLMKPASRREMLEAVSAALGRSANAGARAASKDAAVERRTRKILLAEDNPVNQEVAASMLRRRGHTVDIVENGRAAVDAALGGGYDTILMDMHMPGMDGLDATREIRRLLGQHDPAIIALTANAMIGERERCIAAGMDGYLSKPFKSIDLFAAVEGHAVTSHPSQNMTHNVPAPRLPPAVDLTQLRADLDLAGVGDVYDDILSVFVADTPSRMAALRTAVGSRDPWSIEQAAHAFKSGAATIHAGALAGLLQEIEGTAKAGAIADADTQLAAIEFAYEQVQTQLAHPTNGGPHAD